MCILCDKAKSSSGYRSLLERMQADDLARLGHSKSIAPSFTSFPVSAYSTIEYPKLLVQPMFEPKAPFATPVSYFQALALNGEKLPPGFAHGATRSIFFLGQRLMLLGKSIARQEGEEFFSSFLLAHFEKSEYRMGISPEGRVTISADSEKTAKNLLTGKNEKIKVNFSFIQENLEGKLLSKDYALSSKLFTDQFKRAGMDARAWLTSTEYMFEYVASVAHFSPHPYMLRCMADFNISSQREFQNASLGYFQAHLGKNE